MWQQNTRGNSQMQYSLCKIDVKFFIEGQTYRCEKTESAWTQHIK